MQKKTIQTLLLILASMGVLGLAFYGPIAQWASYHDFADKRAFCGVPNFMDTVSNIAFLVAGIFVIKNIKVLADGDETLFWAMGLSLIILFCGSFFYHLAPNDTRLVWDRLPIASFFSLIFLQMMFELKLITLTNKTLKLAFIYWSISCGSVFLWSLTGDLRVYAFAQFYPLASLLILIPYCFSIRQNKRAYVLLTIILGYTIAKIFETYDYQTLMLTDGLVSGHTTKHAIAGITILLYFYLIKKYHLRRSLVA